jgi:hypothetical protein
MSDPKRLLDPALNTEPELRALLRVARSELPDRDQLERVHRHLGLALAVTAAAASSSAASTGSGASAVGAVASKGVLGTAAAAKLGAAVILVAAAGTAAAVVMRLGGEARRGIDVVGTRTPAKSIVVPRAEPAKAPGSASLPASVQPVEAAATLATRPVEAPRPVAGTSTTPPVATVPQTEDELALLQRASDAVASRPEEALRLADQDAFIYPAGALAQERELIAIQALVRLGRRTEASLRADQFFRNFPGSAHRPRILALLGEQP